MFERLISNVFSGLERLHCFVYFDNVVVYVSSLKEHTQKMRDIFKRITENNPKLQPDKCEFLHHEVCYFRHIISEDRVKSNPIKRELINR